MDLGVKGRKIFAVEWRINKEKGARGDLGGGEESKGICCKMKNDGRENYVIRCRWEGRG